MNTISLRPIQSGSQLAEMKGPRLRRQKLGGSLLKVARLNVQTFCEIRGDSREYSAVGQFAQGSGSTEPEEDFGDCTHLEIFERVACAHERERSGGYR